MTIKGECIISKILVPSDGSKTAQRAAVYAVDLAKQLKASIIVLSVIDKRMFMAQAIPAAKTSRQTPETVEDYLTEAAQGYVGEIKKLCDKHGVSCRLSIKMGYPVEEIAKEAKAVKGQPDRHGFPWQKRLFRHRAGKRFLWCPP